MTSHDLARKAGLVLRRSSLMGPVLGSHSLHIRNIGRSMVMGHNQKPLGRKTYGSIPHLPLSRMGPADHACSPGQQVICCEKARDRHDRIIVTEKLDGSCMSVARQGDDILALGRAGYLAKTSPYPHLSEFDSYVQENKTRFLNALKDGQRFVGEWMNVSTGTVYELRHEPFVAFDLMDGGERLLFDEMSSAARSVCLPIATVVSDGPPASVDVVLRNLGDRGFHGALEEVEGAVWRVERRGKFDFLAKFVRHDKVDGKYLAGLHGNEEYTYNAVVEA